MVVDNKFYSLAGISCQGRTNLELIIIYAHLYSYALAFIMARPERRERESERFYILSEFCANFNELLPVDGIGSGWQRQPTNTTQPTQGFMQILRIDKVVL